MNPLRKLLIGGAMAGTALVGGAIGAGLSGTANAQTSTSSSSSDSSSTAAATAPAQGQGQTPPAPDWSKSGHQANGKTEQLLTGDDATKAQAAAEAAVPGATPQRTETDADGDTYEVHMTKADGSIVTVKLDSNFTVTRTVDGMG
jgi:hypothetical protein